MEDDSIPIRKGSSPLSSRQSWKSPAQQRRSSANQENDSNVFHGRSNAPTTAPAQSNQARPYEQNRSGAQQQIHNEALYQNHNQQHDSDQARVMINTQVTNKSVRSLVSGLSVSIRTGNQSNMAAKSDFQKVFAETIQMNNQKKINAKNAFEVDYFANVTDVKKFINSQHHDKKWVRSGQVVDTGAKVYGFRVDNVHNETYRIWNGLSRNALGENGLEEIDGDAEGSQEQEVDEDGNPITRDEGVKNRRRAQNIRFRDKGGERTLEADKNITLDSFDVQHEKDPLFKRTTQKFDEMRIGNLMTSTLTTTPSLLLQLDSKMAYHAAAIDEQRRSSNQSSTSSKQNQSKLSNAYINIFKNTFDQVAYETASREETFLCQKFEDLIEHVKQKVQDEEDAEDAMIGSKRRHLLEERNSIMPSQLQQQNQNELYQDDYQAPDDKIDDPYALMENNACQDEPERDLLEVNRPSVGAAGYDLNTQYEQEQNLEELDHFINQNDIFLQENDNDAVRNELSEELSQGYDVAGDLNNMVNQFYGRTDQYASKGSNWQTNLNSTRGSRRFSSNANSKGAFGLQEGQIGEGAFSLKNFIDSNRDLSAGVSGNQLGAALRLKEMQYANSSGYSSKITSRGKTAMTADGKTLSSQQQRISKRKKDFEFAKDKIFAHLDLTKPLEKPQKSKLLLNLEQARAAQARLGDVRAAAARQKKKDSEAVPSLGELMTMKEREVNPLAYNCDFSRLTQLFQRPLQIKYYVKKTVKNDPLKKEKDSQEKKQSEAKPTYFDEEGNYLDEGMGNGDDPLDMDDGGDAAGGPQQNFVALANDGAIEVGFEEQDLEKQGFGNYDSAKQQKNLRDMFKVHSMKRFDAAGGVNQEIMLNQFAIRKQVDVKRLKKHLWETMKPKLSNGQHQGDVEMQDDSNQVPGGPKAAPLSAVRLLQSMYFEEQSLDPNNVSLQSSFICMLHLANEEGLQFEQLKTFACDVRQQTNAESDFTIQKVSVKN